MYSEQELTKVAKKTYSRMGLALFTFAAVTLVFQLILGAVAGVLITQGLPLLDNKWFMWLANFMPMYLIGVPVCLLIMGKAPEPQPTREKLSAKEFCLLLIMCFPLMYGGNIIGNLLSALISGGTAENPLNDFAMDTGFLKILFMVILAPMIEEYVFRKKLIDRCSVYGEKAAILFSALCFGLFHMNLFQFFYAFALGLIFGYVYTRTRHLRYSVVMHMVINFLGGVIAPMLATDDVAELLEQITEGTAQMGQIEEYLPKLAGLMLYSFGLIGLSIAGLVLLIVHAPKFTWRPAQVPIPAEKRFQTAYINAGFILFAVLCIAMGILSLLQ